ncbi:glycosyltransferase family 4 protein [Pedobacter sp.]|uniref:glycosyltransferase family 4 protein n=1 Tax=Pedobacter sp. TaxID=1411316 RepID=UPI003D7FA36D
MKIAIISTHPIQYYAPVFQMLTQQLDVKVFYTAEKESLYDHGFQRNISWDIPLLRGYAYEWVTKDARIAQISIYRPTHIIIYGWAAPGHLSLLRYFKNKVTIIFRGDSTMLKLSPWWKAPIKKVFLTWVYQHIDVALYTGTNNKAYFKEYGLKDKQLKFAPHSIDNERFSKPQKLGIRQSLGLSKKDTLVLYTGKLNTNKNILNLIRTFVELKIEHTHLLLVGSGVLEGQLQKEVNKYQNVHLLPFQNQQVIPAYYQACDLFCLPSKNESWGLSINEAMACGKAVLVSDQCGAAIDLVSQNNGKIFRSKDPMDFSRQLKLLLEQPDRLETAGKYSKKEIQKWSFKVQVDHIINCLYDS